MGDDLEWKKLSTKEKITHIKWNARVEGYTESVKLFESQDDPQSPVFNEYLGLIKKMVSDSNVVALEKALDSVLAYVACANAAGKTVGEVVPILVSKCFGSAKVKTKEKAQEIVYMYIEIEKYAMVQEALMEGMKAKQPKVVQGCIQTVTEALRQFGPKVISLKPLILEFPRLLEDRDKNVREDTKLLVIELYKWIRQALNAQLSNLKPVLLQELTAEFEALPPNKPTPERYIRSQQIQVEKTHLDGDIGSAEAAAADVEEAADNGDIDPYELAVPVNILSKLSKDFKDKIESKNWKERKEALEEVDKLTVGVVRFEAGDYPDLMNALKHVVNKDSNIVLVAVASKCITQLAVGLRKGFTPYAQLTCKTVLDRFKERKPNVVAALRDLIDTAFFYTTLDHMSEDIVATLAAKAPGNKIEAALFLSRTFARLSPAQLNKKVLKPLVVALLKLIDDPSAEIRDTVYQALGTAMKVVGEKGFLPLLGEIENMRMEKIKEWYEKAEVVKPAAVSSQSRPKPEASSAASSRPQTAAAKSQQKPASTRPQTAPAKPSLTRKTPASSSSGKPVKKTTKKISGNAPGADSLPTELSLSDDAALDKCEQLIGKPSMEQLAKSAWKERLEGMETLITKVKEMVGCDIPCQALVRVISYAVKPGLKENNFQVLKNKIEAITYMAINGTFTRTSAEICLPDIFDKVGDVKNAEAAKQCLFAISEACSLEFVGLQLASTVFAMKNPKNQTEALNWLSQAIQEFGLKIPAKELLKFIRKGFEATNPQVRQAAINLTATLYNYIGEALRSLLSDEKPALLQLIDNEIDKIKDQKPPAPIRGLKVNSGTDGAQNNKDEDIVEEDDNDAETDLLPRVSLIKTLSDNTMAKMNDTNWKLRKEALEEVLADIKAAKLITPEVGELPDALNRRLGDSNKVISALALSIAEILPNVLGRNGAKLTHIFKPITAGVIQNCLSDAKPRVRQSGTTALNSWVALTGIIAFIDVDLLVECLKKENPFLKQELMGWLTEQFTSELNNGKKLKCPPEFKDIINPVFIALSDRNVDVRKKAQEMLVPLIRLFGWDSMLRSCNKLPGTSKDSVRTILDKAKEEAAPYLLNTASVILQEPEPSSNKKAVADKPTVNTKQKESASAIQTSRPSSSGRRLSKQVVSDKKVDTKSKDEETVFMQLLQNNKLKEQRIKDEQKRKIYRWEFTNGSPENIHIDQLKKLMHDAGFSNELILQLFHSDFKQHIKAIESLNLFADDDSNAESLQSNSDLILKWSALRFYDTNPSMIMRCLEFLNKMFQIFIEQSWCLHDLEAQAFLPHLIIKLGEPKDVIRKDVKQLIGRMNKIYPASKIFTQLSEGLLSKNAKQRSECLDEMGVLIEMQCPSVCQPNVTQAAKLIAKQIGDRDNSVRNAALNTLIIIYRFLGDSLFKMVEPIAEKDRSMLEERIRRSGISVENLPALPTVTAAPPPKSAPSVLSNSNDSNEKFSSQTITKPRKVVGEFQLDAPEIEITDPNEDLALADMEAEFQALLQPVNIPKIKSDLGGSLNSGLRSTPDAFAAVTLVVSQIASSDAQQVMNALVQVYDTIVDSNKRMFLTPHVDSLLLHIASQLHNHGSEMRVLKLCLNVLRCIFVQAELSKAASTDRLQGMSQALLSLLISENMGAAPEDVDLLRKNINLLFISIIDNADRTRLICAMLRLLRLSFGATELTDLVVNCLLRVSCELKRRCEDCAPGPVLSEAHACLKVFSKTNASTERVRRTVKTLVYPLVQHRRQEILKHLTPDMTDSELGVFIRKALHTLQPVQPTDSRRSSSSSSSSSKPRNDALKERLGEIFTKIGNHEKTNIGLNELYDFKQEHPEVDIQPYLSKASAFFNRYLKKGLENIERERAEGRNLQVQQGTPEDLLSELRAFKRAHVQSIPESELDSAADAENSKSYSTGSSTLAVTEPESNRRKSVEPTLPNQQLLDLRARLEKIKKNAGNGRARPP